MVVVFVLEALSFAPWPEESVKVTAVVLQAYVLSTGNLRLIPNPSFPGVEPIHGASTWAHAVSARARNRDWAWRLVDYLTNDPSSALIETTTIIPRTGWDQTEGGRNLRDAEMVARVTQNTYPSGTLIHWDQIQLPMQRAMQRILFENADIQTELNRAKAEVDQAIR